MSTYCLKQSKREELRERIYQNHLAYLAQEESPGKLEKVKTLELLIEEFLMLVPHNEKFSFPSISDVLTQAILNNPEFNAHKAAAAFKAIEKYSTNLLVNPWRKEYRSIKLYCGFYKHTIERHLPSAYSVLIAMGYKQNGLELTLEEPLDPDLVARVALDCFVAFVECQIMIRICEALTSFKSSWADIHRVRQSYVCAVEEATRLLQQIKRAQKEERTPATTPTYIRSFEQDTDSSWMQPNGHHNSNLLVDIANTGGSSATVNNKKTPAPTLEDLLAPLSISSRGRIHLDSLSVSRTRSPSWTEGLSNDSYAKAKNKMTHPRWESEGADPFEVYSNGTTHHYGGANTGPNVAKRWNNDGLYQVPPLEESWDMVDYGNPSLLMSCGNSTSLPQRFPTLPSLGMPPPLLPVPAPPSNNGMNPHHYHHPQMIHNSLPRSKDPFEVANLKSSKSGSKAPPPYQYIVSAIPTFPTHDMNPTVYCPEPWTLVRYPEPKIKTEPVVDSSNQATVSSHKDTKSSLPKRNSFYDNVPDGCKIDEVELKIEASKNKSKTNTTIPTAATPPQIKKVVELNGKRKGWSCSSCTYFNSLTKDICEMCGRSRNLGEESSPLLSGGKQCPQCTLVNDKELHFCSACETSLKDSPTYI